MLCPYCNRRKDRVVESREAREGHVVRRRRECAHCRRRFTTYERTEDIPWTIVKKDGKRESFDRRKVLGGLLRACEKRPVTTRQLEKIVEEIEQGLLISPGRQMSSQEVGLLLMERLKQIDQVAYVRFASVYREFKDVKEFMAEIGDLFEK